MKTYILAALIGYLLGCSNLAYFIARFRGINLRSGGSGNLGASNALLMMGWKSGVAVGIHDIGKAILAVVLVRLLFPGAGNAAFLAGICTVLGHMFPFYLKFRGGKGFASYLGMILAINWKYALLLLLTIAVVMLVFDYIVMGTMTTILTFPLYALCFRVNAGILVLIVFTSAIILYKHFPNLARIWKGTEPRLLKSVADSADK